MYDRCSCRIADVMDSARLPPPISILMKVMYMYVQYVDWPFDIRGWYAPVTAAGAVDVEHFKNRIYSKTFDVRHRRYVQVPPPISPRELCISFSPPPLNIIER